jgi:hypothetical protein
MNECQEDVWKRYQNYVLNILRSFFNSMLNIMARGSTWLLKKEKRKIKLLIDLKSPRHLITFTCQLRCWNLRRRMRMSWFADATIPSFPITSNSHDRAGSGEVAPTKIIDRGHRWLAPSSTLWSSSSWGRCHIIGHSLAFATIGNDLIQGIIDAVGMPP